MLAISGTDTTAAQAQLDSFIEKWKSENVDSLIILGETASAKQFVQKIKDEMPDVQLIADTTTVLGQGQDLVRAGQADNPYDGIITAEGETGAVHSKGENFKRCNAIYKKYIGTDVPGPNEIVKAPNGKRNDIYGAVSDACAEVTMFLDIATKAGATLNNDTWTAAVECDGQDADRVEPVRVVAQGEVRRRRHLRPGGVRPEDPEGRRLEGPHAGPRRRQPQLNGL